MRAVEAQDALGGCGDNVAGFVLPKILQPDIHRAFLETQIALRAVGLRVFNAESRKAIAQRQDSANGTEDLAEAPQSNDGQAQRQEQHKKPGP